MLVCRGTLADAQSGGPDHADGADIAVADAAGRAVVAAQPAWRRRAAAGLGTLALGRGQPADWQSPRLNPSHVRNSDAVFFLTNKIQIESSYTSCTPTPL